MNTTTPRVSPLRQRMIEEMRMRQLAPKTRERLHPCRRCTSPDICAAHPTPPRPRTCAATSCTAWSRGVSAITLNATITGLKFFFEATLGAARVDGQDAPRAHGRAPCRSS